MENFKFTELTTTADSFFELLPPDWQEAIVPFWKDYTNAAKVYGILHGHTLVGGGIVFYKSPPFFEYFQKEAQNWFDQGYHYLGFIWISEVYRNKNLGSFWLNQLKAQNPQQRYFLLTEEPHLQHFYEKNGFKQVKSVQNGVQQEWLHTN